MQVDASILEHYVETLGTIGRQARGGIIRPVYSAAWMEAREQLAEWMRAAGLEVREDAVSVWLALSVKHSLFPHRW